MKKITYSNEFFNIKDTLDCGQVFRFYPYENGFMVFSGDKACFAYSHGNDTIIEIEDDDEEYFKNYFDLSRDYSAIYKNAIKEQVPILELSANIGKGIRILKQNTEETLFSFIVSQNNHIPRIKSTLNRLCENLGKEKTFKGIKYYTFPSSTVLATKSPKFYLKLGLGYRNNYIYEVAKNIVNGLNINGYNLLTTAELKKELTKLKGVGPKVADCVALFGFNRFDSFPVDTWIEKLYIEDFFGKETDRRKMAEYFVNRFGENSGVYQQYLFYYKRSIENKSKKDGK